MACPLTAYRLIYAERLSIEEAITAIHYMPSRAGVYTDGEGAMRRASYTAAEMPAMLVYAPSAGAARPYV